MLFHLKTSDCNIVSYSVRGLRDQTKRRQTYKILKDKPAEIILVQETHITPDVANIWRCEWGDLYTIQQMKAMPEALPP